MPIVIRDLTHTYMPGTPFETRALDRVALTVDDGVLLGIIGHTGSGKSTLIAHLNGLIRPEKGTVLVNGMSTRDKASLKEIRRSVGLVFQYPEYQLFEETVARDIAFGPRQMGLSKEEIEERVARAMSLVGLPEAVGEKSPFDLSGGQKRRVAIAGVLAMEPKILVLDEPAAGLDPIGRREMLRLVQSIHQHGSTVVMVSHSMEDVGRLCDRLMVLNGGTIAMEGTPGEIFLREDELRGMGLDIPQSAQLANLLREKGFAIPQGVYLPEDVERAILAQFGKDGCDA